LPPPPVHIPVHSTEQGVDAEEQIPVFIANDQENATQNPYKYRTEPDSYGVIREYSQGKPSITPDEYYSLADVSDSPYLALDPSDSQASANTSRFASPMQKFCSAATSAAQTVFAPFRNISIFRLMTWFYSSSGVKSLAEVNSLVKDVILAPDFETEDFIGFDVKKEYKVMDSYQETSTQGLSPFSFDDSWIKGSVKIPLPCDGVKQREAEAPSLVVEVYYRKILDIIKAALAEPCAEQFHAFPFEASWQPGPDEPKERIYSEIYTGDRWNEEYTDIHKKNQQGPHCDLEPLLIALMIWSDSTLLAQFGNASLWPIYLYIGNQSKYSRSKPSSFAAHHIAYIPKVCCALFVSHRKLLITSIKLDDKIQENYMEAFNKAATAAMLTHLRRELVQAIWMLLMDDEFMHAYIHGFLFRLVDGILRVLFPRFLTYSADYPEK
jgi:hypothetical protein